MTNIDPERVAEALAVYTNDRREIRAAHNRSKKHQKFYEDQYGVDQEAIRDRYKEAGMSAVERQRKYVTEHITRRAVGLWDAESPEEFDTLMEQAVAVQAAHGAGAEKLSGARAYSDGWNSGSKGGMAVEDNPYVAGTHEHQQWALGCADGVGERPRENGHDAVAEPPKKRGRPRKTPIQPAEDDANDPPALFESGDDEMPATPEMPG